MKVKLEDDGEDNSELIEEIEDSFIEEYIPLPGQYEINEYRIIDLANAQDIWEDKILPLTAKEHDILEALVRNANHIVTIDALCEAVWGDNPFGYGNSLLAHIRRIREKIEITPSKPKSLVTVKGLGYKINVESRL